MGDKAVKAILISYFPFLASPVLVNVMDFLIDKVMTELANDGEMAAFFVYIDFRVTQQGRDFSEAAMQNHEAQKNGTAEQKAIAEQNLWAKFVPLARITS
jgi:Na+/H+ antiporter NhaA